MASSDARRFQLFFRCQFQLLTLRFFFQGHCGLTDTSLSAILTDALALQKVVEPKPNWNVELNSLTDYPPMHELKLKLTELIQIIDNHKDIVECNRDIGPIITDMNSSTTHTAVSSQNENSAVLPVSTKGPSEVCAASSQKENSAVLLDSTRRTSVVRAASSQIENSAVLPVLTKETSAVYATSSEDENCGVLPVYYFGPSLLPAASPQKENSAVLPALTKETSMVCAASSQKKNSAVVLDSTQGTSVVGAASSQDENCTVLPVYYHGTNLVSAAYPQKENSAVLPASTQGTSMVTCHTNITHLNNSFPNLKKKKEEEDVGALRRKYKNKYRYLMNVNNKPSSTPVKKNVDNIPIREIRGPYRHPIFNNVKEVKIINCTTKTSVIRPLSYVLPQIVLKPSDIANCAAIAPRIKKYV